MDVVVVLPAGHGSHLLEPDSEIRSTPWAIRKEPTYFCL